MTATLARDSDWKAPPQDGAVLIWPSGAKLIEQTRANAARLAGAGGVRIASRPLADWRKMARALVGHADERPLIVMGHQAELLHPGVWVKNVVIDTAARACGGRGLHLSIDTDQPKHLLLRWPGVSLPISDDPSWSSAQWVAAPAAPSAAHVARLAAAAKAAASNWSFAPMLGDFFAALSSPGTPADLAGALLESMQSVDRSLGLGQDGRLAGALWSSAPYLAFALHLLGGADAVAARYNAALADYRKRTGTRSATRPMPDLRIDADTIEAPFWLDDVRGGTRARATVRRDGGGWRLAAGEDSIGLGGVEELAGELGGRGLRLSPRALTLTMFVRLMIADQFVHGIGGARYDQVTDVLIAQLFGVEPPAFAVATATLYFPEALGRDRVCLPCVVREGHRLRHGALGAAKKAWLEKIASLSRGSPARRSAFAAMHAEMAAAAGKSGELARWQARLIDAQQGAHLEEEVFSRELFYLVQPRSRLEALVGAVKADFCKDMR